VSLYQQAVYMESTEPSMQQEAQQALHKLSGTTVKTLMGNGLQEWAALSTRLGFSTILPQRPAPPPAPEEPHLGHPPREDDPKYAVELSMLDKLMASRRIKKQDAALKRFEKDRKSWNEDRNYALGLYEIAKKKHHQEVEHLEASYEASLGQWKSDFERYLRSLSQQAA